MDRREAMNILIDLAQQNMLDEDEAAQDPEVLMPEVKRQEEALEIITKFNEPKKCEVGWRVACTWSVHGTAYIHAVSLDEAIKKVLSPDFPFPLSDLACVEGSMEVDHETSKDMN